MPPPVYTPATMPIARSSRNMGSSKKRRKKQGGKQREAKAAAAATTASSTSSGSLYTYVAAGAVALLAVALAVLNHLHP